MPELRVRVGRPHRQRRGRGRRRGRRGWCSGTPSTPRAGCSRSPRPGTVLVDDVTRRASEASIAYEDAGIHQVKGRDQPVHAWTALRVVAGAGGARRSAGLEAPFVGRDAELQTIIDAGDDSAARERARGMSRSSARRARASRGSCGSSSSTSTASRRCATGTKGGACPTARESRTGRSPRWSGRGRGSSRRRSRPSAREKLRATVERFVPDERERRLVEPRLAHLLRLEERPDADRADLFSGWRLFFERMAENSPVMLAFEDLQWADSGLLDFIDYLLEWSADFPIFVLTLAPAGAAATGGPRGSRWCSHPLEPEAIATIARGPRAGTARGADRPDRTPRRGHPAVRRRDDPHAPGPRPARAGGLALRGHRRRLGPRRARDAAGARRLSARRPVRRRAFAAAGCLRARPVVHRRRRRRR